MTYEEFTEAYFNFLDLALSWSKKARKEGLLSLEDGIDPAKQDERDIFMYGMRFVVDGTDETFLDKLLTNIIRQEKDTYKSLLMTIKKEAVLAIQEWPCGCSILAHLLSSYVDIPLNDPRYEKILTEKLF
jgi:flagellar motor component MotA